MSDGSPLCLVTGARGWLGRCVAAHFRGAGWRVRELTRTPSAESVERGETAVFQLGEAVSSDRLAGANALVHCAYDFQERKWPAIEARNVSGSARLFEAARTAGIGRLVCISTMSAFPGCRSLYGRAKLEIEAIAAGMGALVLRPGLIWGRNAGGMFGSLEKQVAGGARVLPLIGGGRQRLYLVQQADLCALLQRFACGEFSAPAGPVTAAHEAPWTLREILEEIARVHGRRLSFVPVPWWPVWAGLKSAELLGLRLNFRSDSLVSLMHQNPHPDFSVGAGLGFHPRPFCLSADL
jgi:nucleoside-diphosphate-sugar epimerase